MSLERLQKRIAASGICSRRAAEKLIEDGKVTVNGSVITELGTKVSPEDVIAVNGKTLNIAKKHYLVMNKPKGYITTLSDPQNRQNVSMLLPDMGHQLKPIGRLDKDTEGVLLFTNDGDLINKLLHPSYHVEKEYLATVEGCIQPKSIKKLESGLFIEGRKTKPAKVNVKHVDKDNNISTILITISEGRKHQVKIMCQMVGHFVKHLKRTRFGSIQLDKLKPGMCRLLTKPEVEKLKNPKLISTIIK